jgi:hypothetical protein
LFDHAFERDHVRIAGRVTQQQIVELLAIRTDLVVDLFDPGIHRDGCRTVFYRSQLFLNGVALRFGLVKLLIEAGHFLLSLLQAAEVIAAALPRHHAKMRFLELRQPLFSGIQPPPIFLDLVLQKILRRAGILQRCVERIAHQNVQHALDDALRHLGIVIDITDRIQIFAAATLDFDIVFQFRQQLVHMLRIGCSQIEARFPRNLFQIRAVEQRCRHQMHALMDIGPDCDALEQRGQHGFGIRVHAGMRLVLVGHAVHHRPTTDGHHPRDQQRVPAEPPGPTRVGHNLCNYFLHRQNLASPVAGQFPWLLPCDTVSLILVKKPTWG